jgi:hypothetical protein
MKVDAPRGFSIQFNSVNSGVYKINDFNSSARFVHVGSGKADAFKPRLLSRFKLKELDTGLQRP